MSAIPITSQQMTLEEYLEFDANAEGRYEYFDGEVFELSGGSPEHSLITSRIGFLLNTKLLPKGCSVYSSDIKLKVPKVLTYRYSDGSVLCGKPIYEEIGTEKLLANPRLSKFYHLQYTVLIVAKNLLNTNQLKVLENIC